ncbi:MAG: hypothetical protein K6A77_10130 [Clostridiales bacterium]|nr:hypothetical protein [Clostridiales bacterium]
MTPQTAALRADGTMVVDGNNGYGQCDVQDWTDITKAVAYYTCTVGLRSDGTVVMNGTDNQGHSFDLSDWADIKQ